MVDWGDDVGKLYRIGELALAANVSKRTIDYYTRMGILTPRRSESNYRFYGEECLGTLQLVSQYKELNMPLAEIKEKVELYNQHDVEQDKVLKYVQGLSIRMEHLEAELREIKPLLETLSTEEKKAILSKISTRSVALAQLLMILSG